MSLLPRASAGTSAGPRKLAQVRRQGYKTTGHRGYKLEELRSYEFWSLLTPKLLYSITHKLSVLVVLLS